MNGKGLAGILLLLFGLGVGVGAVTIKLAGRLQKEPTPTAVRGTLADELQLSPAQNSQMQEIWQDVSKKSDQWVRDARSIQVAEDKELMDRILTTDEQKKAFQELRNEGTRKLNLLEAARKEAFNKAVQQTEQILNEDQRRMYRQIIRDKTGLPDPTAAGASAGWNY